jgi:hypothetical protein
MVLAYKYNGRNTNWPTQVLLMNVPPVLDRGGVEEEIIWHLKQIENSLLRKGKLSTEFVGVLLTEMKVSWRQSKQGKGRTKEECDSRTWSSRTESRQAYSAAMIFTRAMKIVAPCGCSTL